MILAHAILWAPHAEGGPADVGAVAAGGAHQLVNAGMAVQLCMAFEQEALRVGARRMLRAVVRAGVCSCTQVPVVLVDGCHLGVSM